MPIVQFCKLRVVTPAGVCGAAQRECEPSDLLPDSGDTIRQEDKMVGSVCRETAGSRIHTVFFVVILSTVSYL